MQGFPPSYPQQQPGGPFGGGPGGFDAPPTPKQAKAVDRKPTKRLLSTQKRTTLLFAAAVAVLLLFLQLGAKEPTVYVARASQQISPLTGVAPGNVTAVPVPRELVEDGAITGEGPEETLEKALEELEGQKARTVVLPGQQLRKDQFGAMLELNPPLAKNERLVSVRANVGASVAGTLRSGDRVDFLAVNEGIGTFIGENVELVSATVSESILNSAAQNQQPSGGEGEGQPTRREDLLPGDPIPGTYVVRLPVEQAARFALADQSTQLYLLLRNPDPAAAVVGEDPGPLLGTRVSLVEVFCGSAEQGTVDDTGKVICA